MKPIYDMYVFLPLLILGLVGNTLSMIVLLLPRIRAADIPVYIYIMFLTLCDTVYLIMLINYHEMIGGYHRYYICEFIMAATGIAASSVVVAMMIER